MFLVKSSPKPVPEAKGLESCTRGGSIEQTLNDWKSRRATLAAAVEGYLAACADLTTVCSLLSHQPYQRRRLEATFLTIDAELTSLASEEVVLRKARTSLTATRNLSTTVAPIHALPPEVLANIFFIAQCDSSDANDSGRLPLAQLLAGVSSYWRQVATNTSSLWACVDITTAQTNYDYATLLLDRSNNHPIYLTISLPNDTFPFWKVLDKSCKFLIQASRQIHTLDIISHRYSPDAITLAMNLWLSHGAVGTARALRVRALHYQLLRLDLALIEHDAKVLRSVSVLHLDNTIIPWTSTVYHSLVDLRLWYGLAWQVEITISQLAAILASSLGLVTLKIRGLTIKPSDNWDAKTVVQLIHLEVLYLACLSHKSCELLFPLIPLSNRLNYSSIALGFHNTLEVSHLILDFLRDTRTRTLVCFGNMRSLSPQWGLSLSELVSPENLILESFGFLRAGELQTMALEHRPSADEDKSHKSIACCLPHLYLVSSAVDIDELCTIISRYGVRAVHLEKCAVRNSRGVGEMDGNEVRALLTETFPDLVCIVSDIDTTWREREVFDS